MRPPAVAVVGNLIWSRTGKVWACWRVRETPYLWLPERRKHAEHSRLRSLLAGLPAESLILSVAARIDPGEVADALTDGIDLANHPGWADVAEAALTNLEAAEMYRRRHYLCVQLPELRGLDGWAASWRAVSSSLIASFGMDAGPVPASEVKIARQLAAEAEARLRTVPLEAISPGEVAWLYARAPRRGLISEPPFAGWREPRLRRVIDKGEAAVATPTLAPYLDVNLCEGGGPTDPDRPRHRRYLRVRSADGTSYQSFAVVADTPEVFTFPGGLSEWLLAADHLPFPVDWACRIRAVPNQVANRSAIRHQRELASQVGEYDAEPAGPPPSLAAAMEAIDDERAQLAAHPSEPELQVAMIYALWAESPAELEHRVGWLQTIYRGSEFHLPRPTGGQLDLFEAMLPGSNTPRVCRDYRQYFLPRDLAAGMPFAGVRLGDAAGMLLGASRDAGCARPVMCDPASGPRHDRDGSIAAFGTLGAGKSYLAKRLAAAVLLRGGQMLLVDRTQAGEYVRFAAAMAEAGITTQVLTVDGNAALQLDPLGVFTGPEAVQAATGYLGTVCGTDPTSLESATLTRAVKQVQDDGGRLLDVVAVLHRLATTGREYRFAKELALRLTSIADNRFGAPVWNGEGAQIDTGADCTVIHLPNLAIPNREVLLSEHLGRRLLPEQVCSLGLLYLVTCLARRIAYTQPGRFAALCLDEAWALTSTLPGQQLVMDLLRDGRKHNAAGWIFSQQPDDLLPDLRDLISLRFVFGLTGAAARTALDWIGVDAEQDIIHLLESWATRRDRDPRSDTSTPPECLMRDPAGRVGRIQVTEAETESLRAAFESNPTRLADSSTNPVDADRTVPEVEAAAS